MSEEVNLDVSDVVVHQVSLLMNCMFDLRSKITFFHKKLFQELFKPRILDLIRNVYKAGGVHDQTPTSFFLWWVEQTPVNMVVPLLSESPEM